MFPTNGANWNDYVVGADWSTASDVACNATIDTACIWSGLALYSIDALHFSSRRTPNA